MVSAFGAGGVETCFGSGGSEGSPLGVRPGPMCMAGAHAGTSTGAGHAVSSSAGFGEEGAHGGEEGWRDCDGCAGGSVSPLAGAAAAGAGGSAARGVGGLLVAGGIVAGGMVDGGGGELACAGAFAGGSIGASVESGQTTSPAPPVSCEALSPKPELVMAGMARSVGGSAGHSTPPPDAAVDDSDGHADSDGLGAWTTGGGFGAGVGITAFGIGAATGSPAGLTGCGFAGGTVAAGAGGVVSAIGGAGGAVLATGSGDGGGVVSATGGGGGCEPWACAAGCAHSGAGFCIGSAGFGTVESTFSVASLSSSAGAVRAQEGGGFCIGSAGLGSVPAVASACPSSVGGASAFATSARALATTDSGTVSAQAGGEEGTCGPGSVTRGSSGSAVSIRRPNSGSSSDAGSSTVGRVSAHAGGGFEGADAGGVVLADAGSASSPFADDGSSGTGTVFDHTGADMGTGVAGETGSASSAGAGCASWSRMSPLDETVGDGEVCDDSGTAARVSASGSGGSVLLSGEVGVGGDSSGGSTPEVSLSPRHQSRCGFAALRRRRS
jgi:hypothetical protein